MREPLGTSGRRIGTALVACMALVLAAGEAAAYTLITRDGHRIEATAKPEVKDGQVLVRLAPRGRLAVIQESKIDWDRTNAANPAPMKMVVPTDAQLVESKPAPAPIEKRIVGDGGRKPEPQQPPADPSAAPGPVAVKPAPAPGTPNAPNPAKGQDPMAALRKEAAEVKSLLATAREKKQAREKELADLQARQASYASGDNAAQRRVRELQDLIAGDNATISSLESRLNALRADAADKGESID